jgi:hypothetical protein
MVLELPEMHPREAAGWFPGETLGWLFTSHTGNDDDVRRRSPC